MPKTMSHLEVIGMSAIILFVGTLTMISVGGFDRLQLVVGGKNATATVASIEVDPNIGSSNRKWYNYYLTVDGMDGTVRYVRSHSNYMPGVELPDSGSLQPKHLKVAVVVSDDGKKVALGTKDDMRTGVLALAGFGGGLIALYVVAMWQYWVQASRKAAMTPKPVRSRRKKRKAHDGS